MKWHLLISNLVCKLDNIFLDTVCVSLPQLGGIYMLFYIYYFEVDSTAVSARSESKIY